MVMMDLDYFKQVNDTYGHDAGDEVLRQIARLLQNRVRESDIVAGWGAKSSRCCCRTPRWGSHRTDGADA